MHAAVASHPRAGLCCKALTTPAGVMARSLRAARPPSKPFALGRTEPTRGGVGTSFEGVYGRWTLTEADVLEVRAYRASLCVSALAFALCVAGSGGLSGGFDAPSASPLPTLPAPAVDALAAASALGLGAALALVHVYVAPLKRALQLLWLLGCAGAVAVAAGHGVLYEAGAASPSPSDLVAVSASSSIAAAVAGDPGSIWLVGPAAAAATGLAFKEGICFGKLEAALLFLAIPSLCLFHLLAPAVGVYGPAIVPLERLGSVMVSAFALVFAFSKLGQPEAEDIGDKSVFDFRKLGPEEQAAALERARMRAAFGGGGDGSRGGPAGGGGGGSEEEF